MSRASLESTLRARIDLARYRCVKAPTSSQRKSIVEAARKNFPDWIARQAFVTGKKQDARFGGILGGFESGDLVELSHYMSTGLQRVCENIFNWTMPSRRPRFFVDQGAINQLYHDFNAVIFDMQRTDFCSFSSEAQTALFDSLNEKIAAGALVLVAVGRAVVMISAESRLAGKLAALEGKGSVNFYRLSADEVAEPASNDVGAMGVAATLRQPLLAPVTALSHAEVQIAASLKRTEASASISPSFEKTKRFGRELTWVLALPSGFGGAAMWAAVGQYLGLGGNAEFAALRISVDEEAAGIMRGAIKLATELARPDTNLEDFYAQAMFGLLYHGQIKVVKPSSLSSDVYLVANVGRWSQRIIAEQLSMAKAPATHYYVPNQAETREHDVSPYDPQNETAVIFIHLLGERLHMGEGEERQGAVTFVSADQINYFPALLLLLNSYNKKAFPRKNNELKLFLSVAAKKGYLKLMRECFAANSVDSKGTPVAEKGVLTVFDEFLEASQVAAFRSTEHPNLVLWVTQEEAVKLRLTNSYQEVSRDIGTLEMRAFSAKAASPPPEPRTPTMPEPRFLLPEENGYIPHQNLMPPAGEESPYLLLDAQDPVKAMFILGIRCCGIQVGDNVRVYCTNDKVAEFFNAILAQLRNGLPLNVPFNDQVKRAAAAFRHFAAREDCTIQLFHEGDCDELFLSSMESDG